MCPRFGKLILTDCGEEERKVGYPMKMVENDGIVGEEEGIF